MVFIVEFAVMVILGTLQQAHGSACPLNFDYFSKPGSNFLCGSTANYLIRVLAFHTNTTASPRPLFLGLDGCWETISKLDTSPECKSSLEIYSPDYASPCKFATLQELEGNFTIANITFDGLLKVCTSSLSFWELFTSNLRSLSNVTKDTPWVCETALQIALLSTDVLNDNWARKFENLSFFFPLPRASRKRNKRKELAYTVSLILVCSAMPFVVLSYFIWKVLKNPRSASIHNVRVRKLPPFHDFGYSLFVCLGA
ncbi:uncharacterized protein LOC112342776 [Selaginella moellendorffii]|uniref:uncharacterized protein LOC112342776 n=1 Tax=Selaginella moellendorffii TaxID=88036 RepID=UPI000D1CF453|nr:uncharacterized protein LOC112342776 [Selaginella moellendorffii]|eukprot:XP_024520861.1 uncharacterized protein LOC112342776 [Selaginella moellendorffii]